MGKPPVFIPTPLASDSRRSPRRAFNRAVGVLSDGQYVTGQALQISEGGLSFVVPEALARGAKLVLTLAIPGAGSLVLRASVANERAKVGSMHSYGVEFRALDLHQRRMIRSYVSAKTQAEAEADVEADIDGQVQERH